MDIPSQSTHNQISDVPYKTKWSLHYAFYLVAESEPASTNVFLHPKMAATEAEARELRAEIERLQRELDCTSSEKIQSAQYGLVLLEEKEQLEIRCDELETLFDSTKHELDVTKEALARFHESQQESTRTGIEHEESLLHESALRESSLNTQVMNMEIELKQSKAEVQRLKNEKERIEQDYNDLAKTKDVTSLEVKAMRSELKDYKLRETRMLTDYTELEEENINLQKQISTLRTAQIEFEGYRHEIRHLGEEVDYFKHQVKELTNLKRIAEQQLEEALESLQAEREQRYNLKKEMDIKMNNETIYQLGNLALSMQGGLAEAAAATDDDIVNSPLSHFVKNKAVDHSDIENDHKTPDDPNAADQDQASGDHLFSEIHLNELKKLEKQLEASENERLGLSNRLKDKNDILEKTKDELAAQNALVAQMEAHVESLLNNSSNMAADELDQLRATVRKDLESVLGNKKTTVNDSNKMHDMVAQLTSNLTSAEAKTVDLMHDVRLLEKVASDSLRTLGVTQKEMSLLQVDVARLYTKVCQSNHQTPSRIMTLEHITQQQKQKEADDEAAMVSNTLSKLRTAKGHFEPEEERINPSAAHNNVETVKDQVKYLRDAIERLIEISASKSGETPAGSANSPDGGLDSEESKEQIVKLKSLLSTKREQIATLRTVLKANKQTAEVALQSLKSKYDNEKTVVSETMMTLRNELRILKEDAATFSSLRAMFASRCEEYSTQVEELNRQVQQADEERKTLNQLLRMAIHQKLALNQRLEEIEMSQEMRNTPRRSRGGGGGGGPRGGGLGGGRGGLLQKSNHHSRP